MEILNDQQVMSPNKDSDEKDKKWPTFNAKRFGVYKQRLKEKMQGHQCEELLDKSLNDVWIRKFNQTINQWVTVGEYDDFAEKWGDGEKEKAEKSLRDYYRTATGLTKIRAEKLRTREKWEQKSSTVLQHIRESLPTTIKQLVHECEDPYSLIQKIEGKWAKMNTTEHLNVLQQEFEFLKKGKMTVEQLANEIWEISTERALLKDPVSDGAKRGRLLKALPIEYQATIDTVNAMNLSYEDCISRVLDKELQLRRNEPKGNAPSARSAHANLAGQISYPAASDARLCYECGGNHYRSDCEVFKKRKAMEEEMRKANGTWNKNKFGNKKKKEGKKSDGKDNDDDEGSAEAKHFAKMTAKMADMGMDSEARSEYWAFVASKSNKSASNYSTLGFVDSACTDVICGLEDPFIDLKVLDSPLKIYLADKVTFIYAYGMGTVKLRTIDPNEPYITIKNVLYAPKIGENLVSVKKLTLEGYSVVFTPDGAYVSNREHKKLINLVEDSNMYYLHLYDTKAYNTVIRSDARSQKGLDEIEKELGNETNDNEEVRPGDLGPGNEKINVSEIPDMTQKNKETVPDNDKRKKSTETATKSKLTAIKNNTYLTDDDLSELPRISAEITALWHKRLGHVSTDTMDEIQRQGGLPGMPRGKWTHSKNTCLGCMRGRQTRNSFKKSVPRFRLPGEEIHSDVWGPARTKTRGTHQRYYSLFADVGSGWLEAYLMKTKDETESRYRQFEAWLGRQSGHKIKTFRSDKGGEYLSNDFEEYLVQEGIEHEKTLRDTSQSSGFVERSHRTAGNMFLASLHASGLHHSLWGESLLAHLHVRNLLPRKGKPSAWELLKGYQPDTSHLRVWGCVAHVQIREKQRDGKLAPKSQTMVFVGYSKASKGYRFLNPRTGQILVSEESRDVVFDEHLTWKDVKNEVNRYTTSVGDLENESSDTYLTEEAFLDPEGDHPEIESGEMRVTNEGGDDAGELGTHSQQDPPQEEDPEPQLDNSTQDEIEPGNTTIENIDTQTLYTPTPGRNDINTDPGFYYQDINEPAPRDINAMPAAPRRVRIPPRYGFMMRTHPKMLGETQEKWMDRMNRPYFQAFMTSLVEEILEPQSYKEAKGSPEEEKWEEAMRKEVESLLDNDTWELMGLPPGKRTIGCKWVYKLKRNELMEIIRFKARLVAQGFTQREGIDYTDTWAPVAKMNSIRIMLALAAILNLELGHMDVETAYLNGLLEEEIYMRPPPGFLPPGDNRVCRLKKGLYGLKQAGRQWYICLSDYLMSQGYLPIAADSCIFIKRDEKGRLIVVGVFVDDLLIMGETIEMVDEFKKVMTDRFKMTDLGDAKHFLGVQIIRDREKRTITLAQTGYVKKLLEKYRMQEAAPKRTPSAPNDMETMTKDACPPDEEKATNPLRETYRSVLGELQYLTAMTRPDIAEAVSRLGSYVENPGEMHWSGVKRILRYLKGTEGFGLRLGGASMEHGIVLQGYCDADWAGEKDGRRSRTGYLYQVNGSTVIWASKLQELVALSSTEAEYIALSMAMRELAWIRRFLENIGYLKKGATTMFEDNQGCMALAKKDTNGRRTKHIDTRYHHIRDMIKKGQAKMHYCNTEKMIADVLTKPLHIQSFEVLRDQLGVIDSHAPTPSSWGVDGSSEGAVSGLFSHHGSTGGVSSGGEVVPRKSAESVSK